MIRSSGTAGALPALTGNTKGAIEDFSDLVARWDDFAEADWQEDIRPKRQAWIDTLRGGRNPFDAATLKAVGNE